MAEEEIVDAESGTLNKQSNPLEHLRHLLKVGWEPKSYLISNFVEKHGLRDELEEILRSRKGS